MTVQCNCGKRAGTRQGCGPTGRRKWMILVDKCSCGQMYPIRPEALTAEQASWVRRWNARMATPAVDLSRRTAIPL